MTFVIYRNWNDQCSKMNIVDNFRGLALKNTNIDLGLPKFNRAISDNTADWNYGVAFDYGLKMPGFILPVFCCMVTSVPKVKGLTSVITTSSKAS